MKYLLPYSKKGFVFIELVMVLGILAALLGIVIVNVGNIRFSASINTFITTLTADIKNQQTKAMTGDTEGRGVSDTYSVYIQPLYYVLFHGQVYDSSDATNFRINLEDTFQLSTTFPNNTIIFASGSGQILNYVSGQDTITVRSPSTNEQKIIRLNKEGSIVQIN